MNACTSPKSYSNSGNLAYDFSVRAVDALGQKSGIAKGDNRARIYIVGPTERFENDPKVTNKKFPGNPTLSYRDNKGEIIN